MGRREGEMKDKGTRRCGINRSRTDGAICGGMKPGSGEGKNGNLRCRLCLALS